MQTLVIHLVAFWNVVVMNCIQPVNWKYCYRVDQWLIPEVVQGYKLWTGEEQIYQNERKYLESQSDR